MKNFLKSALGTLVGILAWVLATTILYFIFQIILKIPFLGDILYFPAGKSWGMLVAINTVPITCGAFASLAVYKRHCIPYIAAVILMSVLTICTNFTLTNIVMGIFAIISASFSISEFDMSL